MSALTNSTALPDFAQQETTETENPLLDFDQWSQSVWKANPSSPDPADQYRSYGDYAAVELAKQGEYDPETESEIRQRLFVRGVQDGVLEARVNEDGGFADFEADYSAFNQPPVSAYRDPVVGTDAILRGIESKRTPDGLDPNDLDIDKAARTLAFFQSPKAAEIYPDAEEREQKLREAEETLNAAAPPERIAELRERGLDVAVKRGDAPFALLPTSDGGSRLEISPEMMDLADNPRAIAEMFEADPRLDKRLLGTVIDQLTTPEGYDVPKAEINRNRDFGTALISIAQDEDAKSILPQKLESMVNLFTKDPARAEAIFTDEKIRKDYLYTIPQTLRERFTEQEQITYIRDLARVAANPGHDPENPIAGATKLSTGEWHLPVALMLDKASFDKVVGEGSPIPEAQKARLKAMRQPVLEQNAIGLAATFAAQPSFGEAGFVKFREEQMAQGKSLVETVEAWANDPANQSTVMDYTRGIGKSVFTGVANLALAIPALAGNEWATDVMVGFQKTEQDRKAYAAAFGKNLGFGYDVSTMIAPVAVDLLVTRGLAAGAKAMAGAAARTAVGSGVKGLAKRAFVNSLNSDVRNVMGDFIEGRAVKTIAQSGATTAQARQISRSLDADDVIRLAADDFAKTAMTANVNAASVATAYTRMAGMSYVSLHEQLRSERNQDGSPKYSNRQVREMALTHANISGGLGAAVMLGFNLMGLKGVEKFAFKDITVKQARGVLAKLQENIGKVAPNLANDAAVKAEFARLTSEALGKGLLARIGETGLQEGAEEALQSLAESVSQAYVTGETLNPMEAVKQAGYEGLLGTVMGGGITAGVAAYQGATTPGEADTLTQMGQRRAFLATMANRMDAAKLPETAKVLRQMVAQGVRPGLDIAPSEQTNGLPTEQEAPAPPKTTTQEGVPQGAAEGGGVPAPSDAVVAPDGEQAPEGIEEVAAGEPAGDDGGGVTFDDAAEARPEDAELVAEFEEIVETGIPVSETRDYATGEPNTPFYWEDDSWKVDTTRIPAGSEVSETSDGPTVNTRQPDGRISLIGVNANGRHTFVGYSNNNYMPSEFANVPRDEASNLLGGRAYESDRLADIFPALSQQEADTLISKYPPTPSPAPAEQPTESLPTDATPPVPADQAGTGDAEMSELQELTTRRGQKQNGVKGVKFGKKDEARFKELVAKNRDRLLETITPANDPVVGTDINGSPIRKSPQGTFYTVENGRVRTGAAFNSEGEQTPTATQPQLPGTGQPRQRSLTGMRDTLKQRIKTLEAKGQDATRQRTVLDNIETRMLGDTKAKAELAKITTAEQSSRHGRNGSKVTTLPSEKAVRAAATVGAPPENVAQAMLEIVGVARETQQRFLDEVGTTMEQARLLPKSEQDKLQSRYTEWLKNQAPTPPPTGQLPAGTPVTFTSGIPGTSEPTQGVIDRYENGRAFVRFRGSVIPGATIISSEPAAPVQQATAATGEPETAAPVVAPTRDALDVAMKVWDGSRKMDTIKSEYHDETRQLVDLFNSEATEIEKENVGMAVKNKTRRSGFELDVFEEVVTRALAKPSDTPAPVQEATAAPAPTIDEILEPDPVGEAETDAYVVKGLMQADNAELELNGNPEALMRAKRWLNRDGVIVDDTVGADVVARLLPQGDVSKVEVSRGGAAIQRDPSKPEHLTSTELSENLSVDFNPKSPAVYGGRMVSGSGTLRINGEAVMNLVDDSPTSDTYLVQWMPPMNFSNSWRVGRVNKDLPIDRDQASKIHTTYLNGLSEAVRLGYLNKNQTSFSAEAVDTYGIKLPDGYVKQGELYVYQSDDTRQQPSSAKPKDPQGVLKELGEHGFVPNTTDHTAFLQSVAKTGKTPQHRAAAKLLLEFPELITNLPVVASAIEGGPAGANILSGDGTSRILVNTAAKGPRGAVDTVLHEMRHAATQYVVKNPESPEAKRLVTKLNKHREFLRARAELAGNFDRNLEYALSNMDEFIAHWSTDHKFHDIIESLTPKGSKSLVDVILDTIRGLLNSKAKSTKSHLSEEIMKDMNDFFREAGATASGLQSRRVQLLEMQAGEESRFQFAGEQANAPQFMRDSLDTAKAMAAAGKDSETIRAATGWFPGVDGKMRWEIPDNNATTVPLEEFNVKARAIYGGPVFTRLTLDSAAERIKKGEVTRIKDILIHPELFAAYPAAAEIPFFPMGGNVENASFRMLNGEPMITATVTTEGGDISQASLSSLLHEIQHFIQGVEGFTPGGSANNLITTADLRDATAFRPAQMEITKYKREIAALTDMLGREQSKKKNFIGLGGPDMKEVSRLNDIITKLTDRVNAIWAAQDKALQAGEGSVRASLLAAVNKVEAKLGSGWAIGSSTKNQGLRMLYESLAGEVEARDVQARMNFTPEQRAATAPYSTQNIAPEDMLVLNAGSTQQQSSVRFQPADADIARHTELEAKHNAGTITPDETAEAERIVERAAKASEASIPRVMLVNGMNGDLEIIKNASSRERKSLVSDQMVGFVLSPASGNVFYFNRYAGLHSKVIGSLGLDRSSVISGLLYPDGVLVTDATGSQFTSNPKTFDELKKRFKEVKSEDNVFYYNDSIEGSWVNEEPRPTDADPFTGTPLDQRFDPASPDIRFQPADLDSLTDAEFASITDQPAVDLPLFTETPTSPASLRQAITAIDPQFEPDDGWVADMLETLDDTDPAVAAEHLRMAVNVEGAHRAGIEAAPDADPATLRSTLIHAGMGNVPPALQVVHMRRDADGEPTPLRNLETYLTAAVNDLSQRLDARPEAATAVQLDRIREFLTDARAGFAPASRRVRVYDTESPLPESLAAQVRFQPAVDESGMYSAMESVLDRKIQGRQATPQQVKALLTGDGIKAEEVKWSGIEGAIDRIASENNGKVPKDALLEWVRNEGRVRFEEVTLGDVERQQREDVKNYIENEIARLESIPEDERSIGEQNELEDLTESLEQGYFEPSDYPFLYGDNPAVRNTKFSQYTLPGGENYREVVLAMPNPPITRKRWGVQIDMKPAYGPEFRYTLGIHFETEKEASDYLKEKHSDSKNPEVISWEYEEDGVSNYTSSHFPDVPNYVAHMRVNERTDADGQPGLFVEEFQSDRHQAGRTKGYRGDGGVLPQGWTVEEVPTFAYRGGPQTGTEFMVFDASKMQVGFGAATKEEAIRSANQGDLPGSIPDAPHRKDWHIALFKRALRDAVAGGKEWIGWTTGETQNERFDLSKQVGEIRHWKSDEEGYYGVQVIEPNGQTIIHEDEMIAPDKLADLVGKDVAQRIVDGEGDDIGNNAKSLSGDGLKVGGSGMKGFYDNILPKEIGKYVKQWGGKVEKSEIVTKPAYKEDPEGFPDIKVPIWRIDITPEMTAAVGQGQTRFQPADLGSLTQAEYDKLINPAAFLNVHDGGLLTSPDVQDELYEQRRAEQGGVTTKNWWVAMFGRQNDMHSGWRVLQRNTRGVLSAAESSLKGMQNLYEKEVKTYTKAGREIPVDLISAATGSTRPLLSAEAENTITSNFDAAMAAAAEAEAAAIKAADKKLTEEASKINAERITALAAAGNKTEVKKIETAINRQLKGLNAERDQSVEDAKGRRLAAEETAFIRRSQDIIRAETQEADRLRQEKSKAMEALESEHPGFAKFVQQFDEFRNAAQLILREVYGDNPTLYAKIDRSFGIHLVRSYAIHQDKTLANKVLNDPKFEQVRAEAHTFFIKQMRDGFIQSKLRENPDYAENPEALMNLPGMDEELKTQAYRAFEDFILGHGEVNMILSGTSDIGTEFARLFKRKKDIPEALRNALGEIKDPFYNSIRTAQAISRIVAIQKEARAILAHGRANGLLISAAERENGLRTLRITEKPELIDRFLNGQDTADARDRAIDTIAKAIRFDAAEVVRADPGFSDLSPREVGAKTDEIAIGRAEKLLSDILRGEERPGTLPAHIQPAFNRALAELGQDERLPTDIRAAMEMHNDPSRYANWVKLVPDRAGANAYAPLAGWYTDPFTAEAFQSAHFNQGAVAKTTAQKVMQGVSRAAMSAAGYSLATVTLGNPSFYTRNVFGNIIILASIGANIFTAKDVFRRTRTASFKPENMDDDIKFLVARNILRNGVRTNYVREIVEQMQSDPTGLLDRIQDLAAKADSRMGEAIAKGRKITGKLKDTLLNLSEVSETFIAVAAFDHYVNKLTEANFGTEAQIKEEAARRTLMVIPSRTEQSQAISAVTSSGFAALIAPFLRFKADMWRITVNNYKMSLEDRKSDNPAIRRMGNRQLASAATMHGFVASSMIYIAQAFISQISDEEDEAIRRGMPEYMRDALLFYVPGDDREQINFVNLTYLLPHAFVTSPFLNVFKALRRGDIEGAGEVMVRYATEEFLGENIVAGKVMDIARNIDPSTGREITNASDNLAERMYKQTAHVVNGAYTPMVWKRTEQFLDAVRTEDSQNESWLYSPAGILFQSVAPMKASSYAVEDLAYRGFAADARDNRTMWTLTSRLLTRANLPEGDIKGIVDNDIRARIKHQEGVMRRLEAFTNLSGMSKRQVASIAVAAGLSKNRVAQAMQGRMDKPVFSGEKRDKMREAGGDARVRAYDDATREWSRFIQIR